MSNTQVDHHSLFEHVYTFAPIGIALLNTDGTWTKVNPTMTQMLGYSKEELLQMNFWKITHPEDLAIGKLFVQRLLDGELSSHQVEKRYIHKNGSLVWASLHVSLVRNEADGAPLYFIAHTVDITDKKANEQRLLEMSEQFKIISENAQDIISISTPEGVVEYCSPSVYDLLGYRPEELFGSTGHWLYHPDDLKEMQSRSYADNDKMTYRVRHKNGKYLWLETTLKITRNPNGEITRVLGIGRNVTERKRHEDNLAEAQRIAALGSWEWDIINQEVIFSEQVYRICNIDRERTGGVSADLIHLVHPSDQQRLCEAIKRALQGSELNMEFRNIQTDGSIKYIHILGAITLDEQGDPVKLSGTVQDITERKHVEHKLQESIERYTSLKRYNHDAVFSLDLEGNIVNANIIAQQFTGCSVVEMAGVNFSGFIGMENLQRILSSYTSGGRSELSIDKIWHKDGRHTEVLTTIAPIIIHNENVGFYVIAKDITEQKKLIIAKEAAERTNKAKSDFLAMMSHEIRTPMNGVIGMTHLLMDTTELDEQQKEYVEIIRKSGDSLLSIINDILDFSKIESGNTELKAEVLDIRECIAITFDILSPKAQLKRLDVSFTVHPDVPRFLLGDPERLKQVLLNLVGNAVKFTQVGGISVSVEPHRRAQGTVHLKFVVKDTGIGIPAEKIEGLFEPFHQLDNFMTRKSEGTGLGLAISKRLVELMDGEIWVEKSGGPGATFVFTAGFREEVPSALPVQFEKGDHRAAAAASLRILVAEDNEINQLVLQKMLEKLGHTVSIAEDGNQVIRAVAYETFDIIFMDVQMPGLNGLEASQKLKAALPPGTCPIIIAVTANAFQGDREKCLEAGMDDYISKPIQHDAVAETINKFFNGRQRSHTQTAKER